MEYFSRSHQVLALDLPGHGKSSWQKVSLKDVAQDIHFILDHLKIESVNMVGSSLGGLVALKFFKHFPQKTKRLILTNALAKFAKSVDFPFGLEVARIHRLREQIDTDYPAILNIFFRSLFTLEERENGKVKWLLSFKNDSAAPNKEALKTYLRMLEKEDLRDVVKTASIPILFLNGTEDYICSKEAAEVLAGSIVHARVKFFENCGHFPFITKADEFNWHLSEFLRS